MAASVAGGRETQFSAPADVAITTEPAGTKAGHEGEAKVLSRSIFHVRRQARGLTRALAAGCVVALGLSVLVPVTTVSAAPPSTSRASAITTIVRRIHRGVTLLRRPVVSAYGGSSGGDRWRLPH